MIDKLKLICMKAIIDENTELHKFINLDSIEIYKTKNKKYGHYQFNNIIKISKLLNKNSFLLAKEIELKIKKYTEEDEIETTVTPPGFINFILKEKFINKEINEFFKKDYFKKNIITKEKIIIDFSSPNIAKEMHVGHLRSTIIGECLSNILEYMGNKVIKINHLGDWGTQFGILINYIKEKYHIKDIIKNKINLNQLSNYYKLAQEKFNNDEKFKINAKKEVVNLQNENKSSVLIWKKISYISKKEYKKIYKLLDIKILYKGESFYNKMLKPFVKKIKNLNLLIESENAKCISIEGIKNKQGDNLPIIIQKSDGGFNYMTTDLAAMYYRIKYNKSHKIIYITDTGQSDHFKMLFKIIEKLKLNKNKTKLIHIPLGLMLTTEGKKIKTRSGQTEKLINLLKKSIKKTKLINKKSPKYSKIIGINTIKYAELSNNINQNYIFDYEKMLQFTGNTATFLMYAYVRIISIKKNTSKINLFNDFEIKIENDIELDILIHALQYKNIIIKTANELNPNILTTYLYETSEKFHSFFHNCSVLKSNNKYSRLIICEIIKRILKIGFKMLGLKTINKM